MLLINVSVFINIKLLKVTILDLFLFEILA
jgi:hypothetical protein